MEVYAPKVCGRMTGPVYCSRFTVHDTAPTPTSLKLRPGKPITDHRFTDH